MTSPAQITTHKTILAICGSTRQSSSNTDLINAIIKLYGNRIHFQILESLENIPPFNPDLDGDNSPPAVTTFRKKLKDADGILISTPEYAMGVPGVLKNAIDWTVSSMEFSHKPVALITASSVGEKAHASLLETLKVIEAFIPENFRLLISFVKTKIRGGEITDPKTVQQVSDLMDDFIYHVNSMDTSRNSDDVSR
jgi:NAD(P)H-dependent FMN reductase